MLQGPCPRAMVIWYVCVNTAQPGVFECHRDVENTFDYPS